jgi:predicted ester cyclase
MAFPDFRISIDELLAVGDQVVLQWTFTGTHRGPLGDIPASGRHVNAPPGIAIFRVDAGKVIKGQMVWDKYALLQQLGVLASNSAAGAGVSA